MARKPKASPVDKQTITIQLPRQLIAAIDGIAWDKDTSRTDIFTRILGSDQEVQRRIDRVNQPVAQTA